MNTDMLPVHSPRVFFLLYLILQQARQKWTTTKLMAKISQVAGCISIDPRYLPNMPLRLLIHIPARVRQQLSRHHTTL